MQKVLISILLSVSVSIGNCQILQSTQAPLLEVKFLANDYKSNSPFSNSGKLAAGLGFRYIKGLNTYLDWTIGLNGSFPDSASHVHPSTKKYMLIESDFSVRARLFAPEKRWQPYFLAGLGVSGYHGDIGIFLPTGLGIQSRITSAIYLLLDGQYRIALSNTSNGHYFYSIGLAGVIGKGKQKSKGVSKSISPVPSGDRDKDGIPDNTDVCPDQPGLAQFAGCPDTDKDGIPDKDDKCPTIPGTWKYKGCPIPDTDGDGINDEEDQCPTVPGFARYNGCPVPDTDKDGVNDEEDSCVFVPGLRDLHGCPPPTEEVKRKVDIAAKNIFFKTGNYQLLPSSFRALDTIAGILKENLQFHLQIDGHTDNVGSAESNQKLSENRAKSILIYLHDKGISLTRLNAMGYGEERPIADNHTNTGRAINRRVEMKLNW
jgi:OOP family OmpA-OmpF porin